MAKDVTNILFWVEIPAQKTTFFPVTLLNVDLYSIYLFTQYRDWIVYTAIKYLSSSPNTATKRLVVIPDTPANPVSTLHNCHLQQNNCITITLFNKKAHWPLQLGCWSISYKYGVTLCE